MIRKDGFKLIVYPNGKTMRLYDLVNDPQEMNDLAADLQYKEKVNLLFKELLKLQDQMGDPLDLEAIFESS
jgi:arylsulfatase A-like enzyme